MNKPKFNILFFLILFISCSETEKKDYEHYSDRIFNTMRSLVDKDTYYKTRYFDNGQLFAEGWIVQNKYDGEWRFWYADGVYRSTLYYDKGELDYNNPKRKPLEVVLSDSLQIGKKTYMKIQNLYPQQRTMIDNNVITKFAKDADCYDFEVIPLGDNTAELYYQTFVPVTIDSICMKNLYNGQLPIDRNQTTKIYRVEWHKLKTLHIH